MSRAVARGTFAGLQAATLVARAAAEARSRAGPRHAAPPPEGPLRVLMLATYPGPYTGTKYRLRLWAERLERRGFEVEVALPMADRHAERLIADWSPRGRAEFHVRMLRGRLGALARAGRFHTAVVHVNDLPFWDTGPPWLATALRRLAGRVVLDLDDLPLAGGRAELTAKARALGAVADGLIVGNRRLPERYPGRPHWYVPTCVEPTEWEVPDRGGRRGAPVLGWVGTAGNLRNLAPLAPVLAEVCERHGARLRVVCSEPAGLPGVPEDFVRWSAAGEQRDLVPVDIGLAPLLDEPKQRYTCGLKALQCMASGLPVVASPIAALPDIVRDGETGILAATPEQWRDALDRLLRDRELALRMGAAGRTAVERRWSFAAHEERFVAALRGRRADGS